MNEYSNYQIRITVSLSLSIQTCVEHNSEGLFLIESFIVYLLLPTYQLKSNMNLKKT